MIPSIVLAAVFGAVLGSFATAVAHRVPRGISVVGPRSVCPTCGSRIAAYDNVPVLSWLALRGQSRCCEDRISARYPLTEVLVAAFIAAAVAVEWDDLARIAIDCVLVTMLAIITLTDLERRIIPNKVLLAGAILCVAIAAPSDPGGLPERAIAAAAGGGVFFLVVLVQPKGMGLGDVKLVATMGLFLGRALAPAVLIALLAGTVIGLAIVARSGSNARKTAIPFGPFLAFGGVVAMLCGDALVDLYIS